MPPDALRGEARSSPLHLQSEMAPLRRLKGILLMALAATLLAGCSKVALFSELQEEEANEIMAHLMEQKVECVKVAGKEGLWVLQVPPEDVPLAVRTLQALGLPRHKLTKMGDVFQKSGLVSSPTEERIRFIDALSQELASTLMQIDGVVGAKVHIALPNNDPMSETTTPPSAAVFIKYRSGYDIESSTPDLKKLVTKSVEGLTFDNVELIMSPAEAVSPMPKLGGMAESYASLPGWIAPLVGAAGGFLLAALIFFGLTRWKRKPSANAPEA